MRFSLCTLWVLSAVGMVFAQDSNFASGPQYLMNYGADRFARPISTPTMSLGGPALEVGARDATGVLIAGAGSETVATPPAVDLPQIDLLPIYYGRPSIIEISLPEPFPELSVAELPASILDTGVWQVTTPQTLRQRGYGATLGEAAADNKMRSRHAPHVYTNADIDRMHGN